MNRRTPSFLRNSFLLFAASLTICGCVPFWKKDKPSKVNEPMPYHESWCYRTLAHSDCYTEPQPLEPGTLINVEPASRYPKNTEEYRKLLGEKEQ